MVCAPTAGALLPLAHRAADALPPLLARAAAAAGALSRRCGVECIRRDENRVWGVYPTRSFDPHVYISQVAGWAGVGCPTARGAQVLRSWLRLAERVTPNGAGLVPFALKSHRYASQTRSVRRNSLPYDTGQRRYQPQQQAENNPPTRNSLAARA